MSHVLGRLLGADEPEFSLMIRQLEQSVGHHSTDVHLVAELAAVSQQKIDQLGLDAHDTNGPELYHGLGSLLHKHSEQLTELLSVDEASPDLLLRLKAIIKYLNVPKDCWSLKPAAIKKLLKKMPPKNVMEQFGYRSIDSMVKREKPAEILAAAHLFEKTSWQKRFISSYKHLKSSDFQTRNIDILVVSSNKWKANPGLLTWKQNFICNPEMGIIALLPSAINRPGQSLNLLASLIYYLQQIRFFSAYCKLNQVKSNFGLLLSRAAAGKINSPGKVANIALPWAACLKYFSKVSKTLQRQFFEPYLSQEDLIWQPFSDVIIDHYPALNFWRDSEYLGALYPDGVVSYNLLDVCFNYCNNVDYHKRVVYYMREALWHELLMRYLNQPPFEQTLLKQMDSFLTR